MTMGLATDPRLVPGAYISSDGDLFSVVRYLAGEVLLENCASLDTIEAPATSVLRKAALVRAAGAPDPLAPLQAA